MSGPEIYTSPYPFIADTYSTWESDGCGSAMPVEYETWRPGVRWEDRPDPRASRSEYPGEFSHIQVPECDAVGSITITVVSRYRPPGFQERVFYTRQFTDPDGKTFGKGKLFCVTANTFKRRKKGWWLDARFQLSELGKSLIEDAAVAA